ncbi:MAG: peptidase [Gemmatimonadaceae bacterium]|nr:peptidase [Gemmatimonadaceae bacterium]
MPLFRAARRAVTTLVLAAVVLPASLHGQSRITTPKEAFGANFGDDYFLANFTQISAYWRTLASQSDRIKIVEIGKTAEGRPHLMAIVTSPENHRNLARLKEISSTLAHAEGLTDDQAHALAKEGRTVVWIDGGLHATETLGAQQLGETVYQMVSRNDDETLRLLNDCGMLFVHANPDGNELVANWYLRNSVPAQRSIANLPRLYQKYIGHDNNRDFFASTQPETENMNRVMFREWYPQLLYNHHQSGPAGTVVYSPPLRDPYNFNLHPALILGLQSLGAAMHTRLVVENKPGATMRSGGPYDGWWNGGLRNTATFHNTIAVLTEMIGSPTPMRIPFVANRQVPGGDIAMPIAPQEWRFRQSIDYSVSLNRAVLDYASRLRENTLFNFYAMGKSSIERGGRDTWTANPRRISEVTGQPIFTSGGAVTAGAGAAGRGAAPGNDADLWSRIRAPELRDPRGFIVPASQRDFPTAVKFINALLETGITVQRATREFSAGGKTYPAGSYVVPAAQAFRPHVLDMFEPQRHPDVFPFPGSAPTPPYDNAGWTLAFQMGVEFDRILEAFSGPFESVTAWNAAPPAGALRNANGASGFVISNAHNDAFRAVNQLVSSGHQVFRLSTPLRAGDQTFSAGSFYVPARGTARARLTTITQSLGINADGMRAGMPKDARPLRAVRTGLWDVYGGSMPSGWTRWILEQFEFPFTRVFAPTLDAGNLNASYDVLVFPTGAIPGERGGRGGGAGGLAEAMPANLPAEFAGQPGRITPDRTIPQLRAFVENGGTIIAIGSSAANLAAAFKLPIENKLVENGTPLPRTKFYVPGSLLTAAVDTTHAFAQGLNARVDMFFDDSPVFSLTAAATAAGAKVLARFDNSTPLHSGWAWGQSYLENGVAAVEIPVGKGRVVLFGPEILQRAQPHGTFKFLFNGIQLGGR